DRGGPVRGRAVLRGARAAAVQDLRLRQVAAGLHHRQHGGDPERRHLPGVAVRGHRRAVPALVLPVYPVGRAQGPGRATAAAAVPQQGLQPRAGHPDDPVADPAGNLLHRLGLPPGGQPLQRDPDRPDPHPRHYRDPGRLGRRRPVRPAASAAVADHRRVPGHRGRHDLAAGPGPGPCGHLAVDTRAAAVRRRDRGHADRLGQRGPVQFPRQGSGRDLRPVPQRLQPGILAGHRPGRLGPGRRQAARGRALRRRPHHAARDHPHRTGPRRPHPPQANRGHGTGESRRGTCGLATDTVMPSAIKPWAKVRQPDRPRSFDPGRVADLEYRAWVGYYLRKWPQVLAALAGLVREGFGMNWYRTLYGAWLLLRASQLWAPIPGNDPDGARACLRRFYALVRLSYGEPASPAKAAALEVDWWRVHRQARYPAGPRGAGDELVESVTRLYCYLYDEPAAPVRQAAIYRAQAMDLSDRWVA